VVVDEGEAFTEEPADASRPVEGFQLNVAAPPAIRLVV
jgi:hypothetical protein